MYRGSKDNRAHSATEEVGAEGLDMQAALETWTRVKRRLRAELAGLRSLRFPR